MSRSLSVILIWRGITPKWAHDHIVRACDLFLVYFCDYLSCRLSMPSPTQLLRMGWNRQLATNQLPSLMSSLSAALLSKHDLRKDLAHHQLLAHHWHHIFWVTAEIVQFGHYLAFSQMLYIINVTVNPNQRGHRFGAPNSVRGPSCDAPWRIHETTLPVGNPAVMKSTFVFGAFKTLKILVWSMANSHHYMTL